MPQIVVLPHEVLCPDGAVLEVAAGVSVCDALLENDIEIEHACEKSCACTTCHVIVREKQKIKKKIYSIWHGDWKRNHVFLVRRLLIQKI